MSDTVDMNMLKRVEKKFEFTQKVVQQKYLHELTFGFLFK
jgi:hypothetical protein